MTTEDGIQEKLTSVERELVDHVERGEVLDLTANGPKGKLATQTWGEGRTIRAWVVRDIVRGRLAPDADPHGLRLRGARIAGRLDLDNITSTVALTLTDCWLEEGCSANASDLPVLAFPGCRLEHLSDAPLTANGAVTTTLNLNRTTVQAHSARGGICLITAQIGEVTCVGATVRNDSGPALRADGLRTSGAVFLSVGFSATGDGKLGAVRLPGAHIRGPFDFHGATLRNDSGPALMANHLRTDGPVFLNVAFSASGAGGGGTVDLSSAHIGGQLACDGATLRNDTGPALMANGLQTDGSLLLDDIFATGAGENGTLSLIGAHIGGELACDGATLRNDTGPALMANHLRTDGSLLLRGGFSATGAGKDGAVHLRIVRVGGQLECHGATLHNDTGPALDAGKLQTNGPLFLECGLSASGGGEGPVLDLTDLRVGGAFFFDPTLLEHVDDMHARLKVDGLDYTGLPRGISSDTWLRLLSEATPAYAAQPYRQLAAAHRAAGHDREARRVLIEQRRDQIRRRALTGRAARTWARLTGLLLGYGYQPWRALLGLLATLILAALFTTGLGAHGGLARIQTPSTPTPTACTFVERVGVGLDLGTPLISTGTRTRCDTTNSATGQTLTVLGWGLRLLAWGFATLFIAGFTGAVRKT